ncbi:hypothetical protein CI610_02399 [invertebrate metagenome]|uniref:USP domain-containing protein n=1 Tax=invertebrate metagenome TaxID=1711999 RepID=A0A2H9T608_9ZZZZ
MSIIRFFLFILLPSSLIWAEYPDASIESDNDKASDSSLSSSFSNLGSSCLSVESEYRPQGLSGDCYEGVLGSNYVFVDPSCEVVDHENQNWVALCKKLQERMPSYTDEFLKYMACEGHISIKDMLEVEKTEGLGALTARLASYWNRFYSKNKSDGANREQVTIENKQEELLSENPVVDIGQKSAAMTLVMPGKKLTSSVNIEDPDDNEKYPLKPTENSASERVLPVSSVLMNQQTLVCRSKVLFQDNKAQESFTINPPSEITRQSADIAGKEYKMNTKAQPEHSDYSAPASDRPIGPGLPALGQICWINVAIQVWFYSTPNDVLSTLLRTSHDNEHIDVLRQVFYRLVETGKQMINDQRGGLLEDAQREFIHACMSCAREKLFSNSLLNKALGKEKIEDIGQSDFIEFMTGVSALLHIDQAPACCFSQAYQYRTDWQGRGLKFCEPLASSESMLFYTFGYEAKEAGCPSMIGFIEESMTYDREWNVQEIGYTDMDELCGRKLITRRERVLQFNPVRLKRFQMSLGLADDAEVKNTVKAAFLQDGEKFLMDAVDMRRHSFRIPQVLRAVVLHRTSGSAGHYLVVARDGNNWRVCDESRVMEFSEFAQWRTETDWKEWKDMISKGGYLPVYCVYFTESSGINYKHF